MTAQKSSAADAIDESIESALQEYAGSEAIEALGALETADKTAYANEEDLEETAEELLVGYEAQGGCAVPVSGYIDLVGNTWGCVVQGEEWVDICLVQEKNDGTSSVVVWRLDPSDVPTGS